MRLSWLALAAAGCVVTLGGACATGLVAPDDTTADAGGDGTVTGCPQYDLTTDPNHCGSCTTACTSGQVCSGGQCKAQCDTPLFKCSSLDGGAVCADLKTDPNHCGQCATVCKPADPGSLEAGTNNPDAGIPWDGGYDAGPGWSVGTPGCDAGTCAVACPGGMSQCADGICYDLNNHHDHCGDCNTACAGTDWCFGGHCCPPGQEYCNGACTSVLSDNANCGACGNACTGQTPYCNQGTCVKGCVPSGTRQPFNTLSSHTASGCWQGNPCGQDQYSFSQTYGENFQALNQDIVCGGTTACVGHVGVTTYSATTTCEGAWDVYCDGNKVGNINTVGKACTGSAMSNTCSVSFTPASCSSIRLVATAGSGTLNCCAGNSPDSMIVGVSAW